MFRISITFMACCLASGCVTTGGGYPMNWPDPEALGSGACPDINGNFRDAGEMFLERSEGHYVQEPVSLARLLNGWADRRDQRLEYTVQEATDGFESISLRLMGDNLQVTTYGSGTSSQEFDIPVKRSCDDSLMAMEVNWDLDTTVLVSFVDRSTLKLGRATDGSLLVNTSSTDSFVLLYLPMFAGKDERWIRFPTVEQVSAEVRSSATGG